MSAPRRCGLLALAALMCGAPVRADFDWSMDLETPDRDVSVGFGGGVAFGEGRERRTSGALGAVDVGFHHGLLGLHLGVYAHPEGRSTRIGGSFEATWWFLVEVGAGVSAGWATGDPGPDLPDRAVALTAYLGVPVPVARFGDEAGALVVVPFVRPGLRLLGDGEVAGHHQAGLLLKWTSFGF